MAKVYITEYARQAKDNRGQPILAGEEPPVATQTVAIGGASAQSAALNAKTAFVRIHTDAICSILMGTDPTATADSPRFGANQTEYFAVVPNTAMKAAVITNT